MKTRILNLLMGVFFVSLLLVSCSDDKDDPTPPAPVVSDFETALQNHQLIDGKLEKDYTLDASKAYKIKGQFKVGEGVTLTIPAGTNLVAEANGTNVIIAVLRGGKINIQGTQSQPVVMSSVAGKPGDWGGLTICGKATTTAGNNAKAEIGGFEYGGTDDNDNSGTITNLIIKGSGAAINPESEYNGLSLYAVGKGTKIENVAIINGKDDGVEFFGGSVAVKNLYVENCMDDAIDWTEGWNGTIENAYIEHTVKGFSTALEGDKKNKNPKFINLTAVSTVGGTALQFKKESGATITGLSLTGYDNNIDMKDNGPLDNVIIDGEIADVFKNYTAPAKVTKDNFAWVNSETTIDNTLLQGTVTSKVTLDASKKYILNSSYVVEDGGELVIPAGTHIEARAGGTSVYIGVLMGGKIDIQGTATNPVVISSPEAKAGDWGGLTICGKSTTTAGANAVAEIGGFEYGGTEKADNSGSIKYLIIKGTGAAINPESEYNGVSLYAVGSGTSIENVAIINGKDDGIEFFGGTVSVKNIYLENNLDDAIDWTEGWSGTVKNAYIEHTVAGFSTALEGDKKNNNPKFVNLTAISTVGGTALQFKKQSGATITGLSLTGYDDNIDMKDNGPLNNVIIDGEIADIYKNYTAPAKVTKDDFAWVNSKNTIDNTLLQGTITSKVTLDASKKYILNSSYVVEEGGELVIPAGTHIEAREGGTSVYIAVLMGGKIDIQGTASNPVVISSPKAKSGDWGGLTICGKSTTTAGENSIAEVGGFIYGGNKPDDNSGSVKYLVIKGTGAAINTESEYNGVSLYAVGSGTTIENVSVVNGKDDGIEFFGGTVSAKNLYLVDNDDDSVDWTEGWSGTVENVYIEHNNAGFSTAIEGDKKNNNPKFINLTAICNVKDADDKRIALQFKKQSGGTITNLYLQGYTKNIDMKDNGPLENVIIDGKPATTTDAYDKGTKVDVSTWSWAKK